MRRILSSYGFAIFFLGIFIALPNFFLSLSANMVSESSWRDEELKGNPVQVRNYPRSCKFLLGGTFSQPLAVRAGKACRPEQVRRPAVPGRDSLLSGEKRRNGFGCFVVSIAGSVNSIPACVVSGRIAANPSFRRGVFRFFRRVGKKSSDRTTPIWPTKAYGMARNVRLVVFLRRKPGG